MKKIFLFLFVFTTLATSAQKKFDSAAYSSYYTERWEKFSFSAPGQSEMPQSLTTEEKLAGLSKAWAEAKYNFANFDLVPRLNWDSLYTTFIPKAMAATSTIAYYQVLQNFYLHLRDGHSAIFMPYSYRVLLDGRLPLQVRWIEGKALVT